MKELRVIDKNGYSYTLVDKYNRRYDLNIEIVDYKYDIMIGDIMYISTMVVNREKMFTFGKIESEYGTIISGIDDKEIVVFMRDNTKYYFKRIYG